MFPKKWRVLRRRTVVELYAIAPSDDRTLKISFGRKESEICERVRVPHPPIYSERVLEGFLLGPRNTSKIGLHDRRPMVALALVTEKGLGY
jgi:hypothetical protein